MKLHQVILVSLIIMLFITGCGEGNGLNHIITYPTPTNIPVEITPIPTLVPTPSSKPIPHLYPALGVNPYTSIDKVHIIAGIFRASDFDFQKGNIKPEWTTNLPFVMENVKKFYEREMNNQMTISYSIVEELIIGKENIKNYDIWSIISEFKHHTNHYAKDGQYNVWMIYIARDEYSNTPSGNMGAVAVMKSAVQFEFWLDDEAIYDNQFGLVGSAHEYGHLLGLPHPWDLPEEITGGDINFGNDTGDIMGYGLGDTNGILMNYFLGDYYTNEMFKP